MASSKPAVTDPIVIGRNVVVPADTWQGLIDEVDLFNRALSPAEIQAIYNAGSAGKCVPPPPQARALAHWKFNETAGTTAHDSVGTYDGTLSATGAGFVPSGVSGGALSLSKANNGFVNMGDVLGLANTDFSIIAWIKMAAGDTADSSTFLSKHAAYTRNGYILNVNKTGGLLLDNKASFIEGGSGVGQITTAETPISTTSVNDGNWHQIVAVYQTGGSKLIYVDGAPAEDSKLSQPFNQNAVALLIGGANFNGVPTGEFNGLVDEVQIYNYALVNSDVDFLFHNPGQEIAPHDLPTGDWRLNTFASTGGAITRSPDLAKYTNGSVVTVTAIANPGFVFAGWSGDANGTNNPITVMMTNNKTVTASFNEISTAKALAHWKFDETNGSVAHDSAGSYNGTLSVTGANFVSGGVSGGALSLSKTNNGFVNMGNVLGLGNTDFSFVAWIKMAAGDTTDNYTVLSKHAAYTRNGYIVHVNKAGGLLLDNKASFYEGGTGVAPLTIEETPISTTSVNDGDWHQIVAVYQAGGTKSIYVDGAPAEDTKLSQPFNQNTVAFLIGGVNFEGTPTGLFNGLIDDVQIYNYDLSNRDPGQEIAPHDLPPGDWRLNTIASTGGTITRSPDLGKYTNGATVTVTAIPSPGFVFTGWSGDVTGTNNPITVTMTNNKTVTASFNEIPVAKALAHWKFDETNGSVAHDSAGTFDGALSPAGASFVPGGISRNAIRLSKATNGFVNMGDVLRLDNGDFTVMAWIKLNAGDTAEGAIVGKQITGFANGYILVANGAGGYSQPNKAWFYESDQPGQEVTSSTSINDGNWHQIVGVCEASGNKYIYVDGAPAEASKASRPMIANEGKLLIGGLDFGGTPGSLFTGLIDEVQIYNYALSSSEIDFLFQNPSQEIPPHQLAPGQWRLTTVAGVGGTTSQDPDLATYTNGAVVTVTAIPNSGFVFTGWSGDVTGTNNPITITMTGNKTVTASFREIPARVLAVVNPPDRQEGLRVDVPVQLISHGDVGGMSFVLHYDAAYLGDPQLTWSSVVGSALDQVNYDVAGQVQATFALPATAVPEGTQAVATVSFRARSVPSTLSTDLPLEVLDVSSPAGNPIVSGTAAVGGSARILLRRVIGDNNANDRYDVGDATIMQRLLTGLMPKRSWDVSENDVNQNANLDSGDVIRVLRAVVGLDPQPQVQSMGGTAGRIAKMGPSKAGPSSNASPGIAVLSPDGLRGQPGDLVTIQVRLQDLATSVDGVSFILDYPTNALRLVNSQSTQTGAMVPAGAVTLWNVQPAQNNYALQTGRVSVAMSSATVWPTNSGVLAQFTFQVQPGQSSQYCWPIQLSGLEVTSDGYDIRQLPATQMCFIGRDPLPANLSANSSGLSVDGFKVTLSGDAGLSYTLEVSTDLLHWTPLSTLSNSSGGLNFVDPEATNSGYRFYRAKQQY